MGRSLPNSSADQMSEALSQAELTVFRWSLCAVWTCEPRRPPCLSGRAHPCHSTACDLVRVSCTIQNAALTTGSCPLTGKLSVQDGQHLAQIPPVPPVSVRRALSAALTLSTVQVATPVPVSVSPSVRIPGPIPFSFSIPVPTPVPVTLPVPFPITVAAPVSLEVSISEPFSVSIPVSARRAALSAPLPVAAWSVPFPLAARQAASGLITLPTCTALHSVWNLRCLLTDSSPAASEQRKPDGTSLLTVRGKALSCQRACQQPLELLR